MLLVAFLFGKLKFESLFIVQCGPGKGRHVNFCEGFYMQGEVREYYLYVIMFNRIANNLGEGRLHCLLGSTSKAQIFVKDNQCKCIWKLFDVDEMRK